MIKFKPESRSHRTTWCGSSLAETSCDRRAPSPVLQPRTAHYTTSVLYYTLYITAFPRPCSSDLHVVQQNSLSQLQAQRGQHQVSRDVVVVGQRGSGKVTAQRDGVQQQLLQLFGHHGRLRLVQTHVHRVRNHVSWDQTLIILQRRRQWCISLAGDQDPTKCT